jgi:AraC-like DNA-binding protein
MLFQRPPAVPLQPFIARLWASDGRSENSAGVTPVHEHVLPTGWMHVVVRLTEQPLYLLGRSAEQRVSLPPCLVGGARSTFHARLTTSPSCSVGALLRPGAASLLFSVPAGELAESHTSLEDLWGAGAPRLRDELSGIESAEGRLALFERRLGERLPLSTGLNPEVAALLQHMRNAPTVRDAVRSSGLSHRRFIADFRHAVGLAPKTYAQVRRFQSALRLMRSDPAAQLADVAFGAGYSDQSHFGREFLVLAGVTPAVYRQRAPAEANHLPVAP